MCPFGSQKMKHSRKKCFKNGFESNRSKPQIWSACTWHHSRWSLCVCVCMCGLHEWINPCECSLNASVFSYRSFASQQPAALSPPLVSNTVFCPSSLLAYAGAHKVVIFFKVRMFGCTPVKLSKQATASSSGGTCLLVAFWMEMVV